MKWRLFILSIVVGLAARAARRVEGGEFGVCGTHRSSSLGGRVEETRGRADAEKKNRSGRPIASGMRSAALDLHAVEPGGP